MHSRHGLGRGPGTRTVLGSERVKNQERSGGKMCAIIPQPRAGTGSAWECNTLEGGWIIHYTAATTTGSQTDYHYTTILLYAYAVRGHFSLHYYTWGTSRGASPRASSAENVRGRRGTLREQTDNKQREYKYMCVCLYVFCRARIYRRACVNKMLLWKERERDSKYLIT